MHRAESNTMLEVPKPFRSWKELVSQWIFPQHPEAQKKYPGDQGSK